MRAVLSEMMTFNAGGLGLGLGLGIRRSSASLLALGKRLAFLKLRWGHDWVSRKATFQRSSGEDAGLM